LDFVNGPWKKIEKQLPALKEKNTYHPYMHSIARMDIVEPERATIRG